MNVLLILVIVGLGIMFMQGVSALKTGNVEVRSSQYSRTEDPVGFWVAVLSLLIGPPLLLLLMFLPRH